MSPDAKSARSTVLAGAGVTALVAAFAGAALVSGTVVCGGDLRDAEAPAHWRALPRRKDLAPFRVEGRAMMVKYGLGRENARLVEPSMCPREGVSLMTWFDSIYRHDGELFLREDASGTFVVSGADRMGGEQEKPPEAEKLVAAFRRVPYTRLGFKTDRWAWFVAAIGTALAIVGVTTGLGVRALRLARAIRSPEPAPEVDHRSAADPGADDRAKARRAALLASAKRLTRRGILAAVIALVFTALGTACAQVADAMSNMI